MPDRVPPTDRRSALEAEIRTRLGLVPAFFRAPATVEIAELLWSQARAAYLDSPIPFAVREMLFIYLSRFCPVPYCAIRHAAFLLRRAGTDRGKPRLGLGAADLLTLLEQPVPDPEEIQGHLKTFAGCTDAMVAWPGDADTRLGRALFRCSVQIFLGGGEADRCHAELRRVLGAEPYQHLIALLAFVRTAHAWTEAHPDLEFEDDVAALLQAEPGLRRWIENYREDVAREIADARVMALKRARSQVRELEGRFRSVEESLEKADALAQTVFETAPDAILTTDEAGVITVANGAAARLFGYEPSELVGQNVKILMPSPYAEEHDGYLERYRRTGEARIIGKGREVEGRRKDGSVFPIRLAIGEGRYDGSRLFTGVLHDLSEVRDLQRQLLQAQKLEAVGALAGGVAHDFNNLLTSIRGSSEILVDQLEPEGRLARAARRVQRAADRGAALTSRLLAFSRRGVVQRRVIDLNEVVRETEELCAHTLPEDLAQTLELADGPLHVRADENQLGQVLLNLVVNAADAMPQGGRLTVATGRDGNGAVSLEVRDTGEGIPDAIREKIFEPFFTTKERGRGTGLGLATAASIVREHGGEIRVVSEAARGTTFTVLLPEADAPDREQPAAEPEASDGVLADGASLDAPDQTILLVEDDEMARELLVEVLEEAGYSVVPTAGPEEALERARQREGDVDLLVTDVVLPGMTGLELARELRARNRRVRVLYMSGYSDQALADRVGLGAQEAFLRKPFGNSALLDEVRKVLGDAPASERRGSLGAGS